MKSLLAACAVAVLIPASGAQASDTDILIRLGELRAAHGLPPVTEVPELSAGCRALMAYRSANGGTVGSRAAWPEAAKKLSWWVDAGAWALGGPRPTAQLPNADAGLVTPAAQSVGVGDGCLGFGGPARTPPDTASLVPFPGDGTTDAPYEQMASQEFPQGNLSQYLGGAAQSGPYLRVFAWGGAFARVAPGLVKAEVSASLVDQEGQAVPVRFASNGALATWAGAGTAVVVPNAPLEPRAWYSAVVSYRETASGVSASRSWRFRTAGRPPATTVDVTSGGRLFVSTESPASAVVRLTRQGEGFSLGPFGRGQSSVTAPMPPGEYRLCVRQEAVGPYDGVDQCSDLRRSWAAPITFRAHRLRGGRIRLRASAPSAASGLRIHGRVVAVRVRGRWKRTSNGVRVAGTLRREPTTLVLRGSSRLRGVSAVQLRSATNSEPTFDGQRWLDAPQTTTVSLRG